MHNECSTKAEDSRDSPTMVQARWIELSPFEHQVGGMTRIFAVSDTTVCKPCLQRELLFYRTMPSALVKFTPCFTGMLDVRIATNESNERIPLAYPIKISTLPLLDDVDTKSGSHDVIPEPVMCLRQKMSQYRRSYAQELQHIDAVQKQSGQLHYMAFDNILAGFHRPSILDLKVGLRLYGDDHAIGVRDWKAAKYSRTTSRTLGLRNCGMKVYNRASETYSSRDKYECFNYDNQQFLDCLSAFLHDGVNRRRDVIRQLVRKLHKLRDVISSLSSVRFYAVSVLLVYDIVSPLIELDKPGVYVAMGNVIDTVENGSVNNCANMDISRREIHPPTDKTRNGLMDNDADSGKMGSNVVDGSGDVGFVSSESESINRSQPSNACGRSRGLKAELNKSNNVVNRGIETVTETESVRDTNADVPTASICDSEAVDTNSVHICPKVSVKLIDFAHATHSGLVANAVVHTGPHRGFIFGLDNLIRILNEIHNGAGALGR